MTAPSVSRRTVLRQLALAITAAGSGSVNIEAARLVHTIAGESRAQPGGYTPIQLTDHEFRTVSRLAELIVPADARGGSAVDAGAPEFIDLLCSQNDQLTAIYRNGIRWLDATARDRSGENFIDTSAEAQTDFLDGLVAAERGRSSNNLREGVSFFGWIRRMAVDAYYTSPIGIRDIGYQGNQVLSSYETPSEVIDFVTRAGDDLGL
ncbi:MAG: gluconate 2-dehydrogenase subunit 3 family protein [Acidobacteriota bacterium]|nr:gluconate 2-dehydrogenase subunit 3 family protein [Acidobacteriota bacterium]